MFSSMRQMSKTKRRYLLGAIVAAVLIIHKYGWPSLDRQSHAPVSPTAPVTAPVSPDKNDI